MTLALGLSRCPQVEAGFDEQQRQQKGQPFAREVPDFIVGNKTQQDGIELTENADQDKGQCDAIGSNDKARVDLEGPAIGRQPGRGGEIEPEKGEGHQRYSPTRFVEAQAEVERPDGCKHRGAQVDSPQGAMKPGPLRPEPPGELQDGKEQQRQSEDQMRQAHRLFEGTELAAIPSRCIHQLCRHVEYGGHEEKTEQYDPGRFHEKACQGPRSAQGAPMIGSSSSSPLISPAALTDLPARLATSNASRRLMCGLPQSNL